MNSGISTIRLFRQKGVTLIEILIAVLVLSISILGLSALQLKALRDSTSSYYFSQVTTLAYDIADRIRTNSVGDYISPLPNGTLNTGCTTTTGCSSAQMAAHDIYEWQNSVGSILPSGSGTISVNGTVYTVSISWDDNRTGSADKTLSMEFQL